MRILEIITVPFFTPRGTSFSSLERTKALARLGHEIDVLAYPIGDDVSIPHVRVHRTIRVPFIRGLKMGPSLPKLVLDVLLAIKTAWFLLTRRYDLVHVHEESAFWVAFLRPLHRGPVLYDMHSSLAEQLANFGYSKSSVLHSLFAWLEKRSLARATGVIAICPELEAYVRRVAPDAPVQLIENLPVGWDLPDPTPAEIEAVRDELKSRGRRVVLYTGTFGKNQGLDLLLEGWSSVLAEFPDAVLACVGGTGADLRWFEGLVAERGLADRVVTLGPRDPSAMPAYMAAAEALVSPRTHGTNTPLKIYSYLASAKPIVATDLYTHRQALDETTAELTPATAEGLASGVRNVLRDPRRAAAIGAAGKRLLDEKYGHSVYMARLQSILERTCRTTPVRRGVARPSAPATATSPATDFASSRSARPI